MKTAVLMVSLLSTACVPVVNHGPWVRPGLSGSAGATLVAVTEAESGGEVVPMISFDGGVRWGLTSNDSSTEGVSFGVNVPMISLIALTEPDPDEGFGFLDFINFDGYLVTPVAKELNASFGVTRSSYHTMPYAQLGKAEKWYTTQALLFSNDADGWAWAPSFTWLYPSSGSTRTHVTFTGSIASDDNEVYWMAGFSIIFEFARARN